MKIEKNRDIKKLEDINQGNPQSKAKSSARINKGEK